MLHGDVAAELTIDIVEDHLVEDGLGFPTDRPAVGISDQVFGEG